MLYGIMRYMEDLLHELMTLSEVAEALRASPTSVLRWVDQGRIPAIKLGVRAIRFRRSDVEALLSPKPAGAAS